MEAGDEDRWIIRISEFARIDVPDLWDHGRNPVRYVSLEGLEINPLAQKWEPVPEPVNLTKPVGLVSAANKDGVKPLTMAEAKSGLALTFNVPADAIEITIRG